VSWKDVPLVVVNIEPTDDTGGDVEVVNTDDIDDVVRNLDVDRFSVLSTSEGV
jgi:hypothetical protein